MRSIVFVLFVTASIFSWGQESSQFGLTVSMNHWFKGNDFAPQITNYAKLINIWTAIPVHELEPGHLSEPSILSSYTLELDWTERFTEKWGLSFGVGYHRITTLSENGDYMRYSDMIDPTSGFTAPSIYNGTPFTFMGAHRLLGISPQLEYYNWNRHKFGAGILVGITINSSYQLNLTNSYSGEQKHYKAFDLEWMEVIQVHPKLSYEYLLLDRVNYSLSMDASLSYGKVQNYKSSFLYGFLGVRGALTFRNESKDNNVD
ncbi:MAG: hypothetical protein JXR19_07110 [Bacteroidia bacterium]